MNLEKTKLLSADIMRLLKQIYSEQKVSNLEKDLLKEKLRAMYEAIDEDAKPEGTSGESDQANVFASHRLEFGKEENEDNPNHTSKPEWDQPSFSFIDSVEHRDQTEKVTTDLMNQSSDESLPDSISEEPMEAGMETDIPGDPYIRTDDSEESKGEVSITSKADVVDNNYASSIDNSATSEETVQTQTTMEDVESEVADLFYFQEARELSDRLGLSPIADLTKALGINDRLLTVNELFGGDYAFFDESFRKLNSMNSFEEAKSYLTAHVVKDQDWLNPNKKERAKRFIKFIKRRYIN